MNGVEESERLRRLSLTQRREYVHLMPSVPAGPRGCNSSEAEERRGGPHLSPSSRRVFSSRCGELWIEHFGRKSLTENGGF